MRQLNQIMNDAALSTEEFREVRAGVIEAKYVNLAGRQVLPIRKVSIGRQEYGFDKLSDLGTAEVIAKATNFPGITVNKVRTLTPVLKHGVAFNIAREDLLSSREYGEALNTVMARRASRLTQNAENETIILQSALAGVNGLYVGAGHTYGGATWGTASNIPISIMNAMIQLDDEFEPTDLLCHKDQYFELFQRQANTDLTEYEKIQKLGITPRLDRNIASGTALMMQSGADIAELIVAEDLDVEEDYAISNQSYKFNTYLRSVPAIYEANALCTITGI